MPIAAAGTGPMGDSALVLTGMKLGGCWEGGGVFEGEPGCRCMR